VAVMESTGVALGAVRPDLEQVFRAEYAAVVAVARRVLADRHAAEDVAQEVFVAFGGTSPSAVPRSTAPGWLRVAAAHTALNLIRSGRRREERETRAGRDPALAGAEAADPADTVVRRAQQAAVCAALARLSRPQALALVLRHSGSSYAEIADALGIAPGGVGTTLRRAEAALREELIRHGSPS
jgi:RNA polymerase sigma factor (sigma-70 family)